ncbi:MAG TPA: hypothetical protein PKD61_36955 [Polyangiaceae bacterium]|nr:hypothetical protein [Polyangiaceae bacterium]
MILGGGNDDVWQAVCLDVGIRRCVFGLPEAGTRTRAARGKLHLCTHGQVCVCNAKECVANSSGSVPFDFRWQHDELEGSSGLGQRAVLRLKRQR